MKVFRIVLIVIGIAAAVEGIINGRWLSTVSGFLLIVDAVYSHTKYDRGVR